eukprot:1178333-Karenia_brevis.AAC.1
MPSEQELRNMRWTVERSDRSSRRKQESKMRMMSDHGYSRKCGCNHESVARDDRWVQLVGVDEDATRMRLSSHMAAVSNSLLA